MLLTRGGMQSVLMLTTFMAISLAPLATVTALRFTGPLFATLLALVVLHEIIRMRRISALVIGFAGAMIILRPESSKSTSVVFSHWRPPLSGR